MPSIYYPSRYCFKTTVSIFTLCAALFASVGELSADQTAANNNSQLQQLGLYGKVEALFNQPRIVAFRKDNSGNAVNAPKQQQGDPAAKFGYQQTTTQPMLTFAPAASSATPAAALVPCSSTSSSLKNPNFEAAQPGVPAQAMGWCDVGDFGYSRVQVAPSKYNYVVELSIPVGTPPNPGGPSPHAAVSQTVNLNQKSFKNVFVGGMVKGVDISGEWGAFMEADFELTDGTVVACITDLPNLGTFDWRWIGLDAHHCLNADQSIKRVTVSAILQDGGTADFDLLQLQQLNGGPGAVTIMFDDGLTSASTLAEPYLNAFGYGASSAVITSLVNTTGFMSVTDLQNLKSSKWDIVSHSKTHPWFPGLSVAMATAELKQSKAFLNNAGFAVEDFAWPFGGTNGQLTALAQSFYKSTRRYDVYDDNGYGTFPYNVSAYGILKENLWVPADEYLAWIQGYIDDAKTNGHWAILVFHDIGPINDPNNDYINSPEFLSNVLNVIKNSGIQVLNYKEGRIKFANVKTP